MAYLNIGKFGEWEMMGFTQSLIAGLTKLRFVVPTITGVPKPFRYCFAVAGFLLLICLQKQAFDTASKQKTLSLS
jgi:hypothetical protein